MLFNTVIPLLLINTLVSALPSSSLADPEFRKAAKRALVLRLVKEIEEVTRDGGKIDLDALLSPEERQLIGGGDEYAPYQVPCPTGFTWVRSADVSWHYLFLCSVEHVADEISHSASERPITSINENLTLIQQSTSSLLELVCPSQIEHLSSVSHSVEEDIEPCSESLIPAKG